MKSIKNILFILLGIISLPIYCLFNLKEMFEALIECGEDTFEFIKDL